MAKKIKLQEIKTLTGGSFSLAKFDENEQIVKDEKGMPETYFTSDMLEIIEYFVLRGLPREKYTRVDGIRSANIYKAIKNAAGNEILVVDDEDHKWLQNKLEDDNIGVRMFTHNLPAIIDAITTFEKD
jgi:hypothetical protein